MKMLFVIAVVLICTFAFGSFVVGLGGLGLSYGIVAGITSDDFSLFGFSGSASLFAAVGTGIGVFADFTPFELFSGVLSEREYRILLGVGAGGSFGFLLSGGFNIGAGITLKVLWGEHFLSTSTVGFGLGGFYSDSVLAYIF